MRDIINDERQRLGSQILAAQRVASGAEPAASLQLGWDEPHPRPRHASLSALAARNAPVRLLPRAASPSEISGDAV